MTVLKSEKCRFTSLIRFVKQFPGFCLQDFGNMQILCQLRCYVDTTWYHVSVWLPLLSLNVLPKLLRCGKMFWKAKDGKHWTQDYLQINTWLFKQSIILVGLTKLEIAGTMWSKLCLRNLIRQLIKNFQCCLLHTRLKLKIYWNSVPIPSF